MTTTELMKKAHQIASKFLKVTSVSFETLFDSVEMDEQMRITIFYQNGKIEGNFSVTVYSFQGEKYSVSCLLKKVEVELETLNDKAIKSVEVKL